MPSFTPSRSIALARAWTHRRHQLERVARHRHGGARSDGAATRPRTVVREWRIRLSTVTPTTTATGRAFVTDCAIDRHWPLSEHKIKNGMALLSGTTFVELARAAFSVGKTSAPSRSTISRSLSAFQVARRHDAASGHSNYRRRGASEITMRTAGDDATELTSRHRRHPAYNGGVPRRSTSTQSSPVATALRVMRGGRRPSIRGVRTSRENIRVEFATASARRCSSGARSEIRAGPGALSSSIQRCSTTQLPVLSGSSSTSILTPISMSCRLRRLRSAFAACDNFFSHVRLRPESGHGEPSSTSRRWTLTDDRSASNHVASR